MANNTNINMTEQNNGREHHHDDGNILPMSPPTVDPHRPPVFIKENTCPCACDCTHGGTEEVRRAIVTEANYAETAIYNSSSNEGCNSYASSAQGDEEDGDEGADDRLIDVGDFGKIPAKEIIRALIKHGRCPVLPSHYTSASNPPTSDFRSPASSMAVELGGGSGDQSMAQSMTSSMMSHFSRGSSAYGYTGEWVHQNHIFSAAEWPLIHHPLRLTAEVPFPYPMDLSISESEFGEH